MPLRYDAERGALSLARRLVVRVDFGTPETLERGGGSVGRREPRKRPGSGETLVHLGITQPGLHAASFESLFPGRAKPLDVATLRLVRQDQAVPFHVEPDGPLFGPGSVLYFHADSAASSWSFSGEVVYSLERSRGGVRMGVLSAPPSGEPAAASLAAPALRETNRYYMWDLLEAPDIWVWDLFFGGSAAKKNTFSLEGVDLDSSATARLEVYFVGGSDAPGVVDHHVEVSLNGILVGDTRFDGMKPFTYEADVPVSQLRDGVNELSIKDLGDTGVYSRVFLDKLALDYPRRAQAVAGRFEGAFAQGGTAALAGLDSPPALVALRSDGVDWLRGFEWDPVSLRFSAQGGVRYLAVSSKALLSPRVFAPVRSSLRSTQNQADYILIAPQAFLPAAEPLIQRRQDQGLTTLAASLEEISSAFGHGQPSAEAIREFLSFAFHSWKRPSPRYVLLLGDSSSDPRRFFASAWPAPLPALWTRTSYIWTVSDPTLAAVNGDDSIPDLAIGRLPATTLEQAHALVAKLLDWEGRYSLDGPALLVADNPDAAGDFEADAQDIASSFLAQRSPELAFLSQLGVTATRERVLGSLDQGLSLLSYVGHGLQTAWASEYVLLTKHLAALQAQPQQPLLVTMNCLNGYFTGPTYDSMAEVFLKAQGRGAIAAFSPSGLSVDSAAHLYHRALMAEITSTRHARIGDAVLAAQKAYADTGVMPELLGVYQLLGDPAMRIRP